MDVMFRCALLSKAALEVRAETKGPLSLEGRVQSRNRDQKHSCLRGREKKDGQGRVVEPLAAARLGAEGKGDGLCSPARARSLRRRV